MLAPPPCAPVTPGSETDRLRSLRAHDVLRALVEPLFDEFVALTAQVFGLPISLLAVVEEADVLYPAQYGLPPVESLPRTSTLCATALAHDRTVVYHDLAVETAGVAADAVRTASRLGVRFYAGALVYLPDQRPLGTLCVVDRQPRVFSADEQRVLGRLADLVSHALAVYLTSRTAPDGARQWHGTCGQLQAEVRALAALVRYLRVRQNSELTPLHLLAQVERRLCEVAA